MASPHQNYLSNHAHVQTQLGLVIKCGLHEAFPVGFRVMKMEEGIKVKEALNTMLGQWSIVAFEKGKLDGFGYGNKFMEAYGAECGERFIIEDSVDVVINGPDSTVDGTVDGDHYFGKNA